LTAEPPDEDDADAGETGAPAQRRRSTINDIARLARVSKKTVSRVINRSPFVREETRARIEAVIAEMDYSPDPQARGLAFRRSFLIGLVYDNPTPQYVVNMQLGILDGLRGTGFELVVHPCDRASPSFLADIRGFIERQKLAGVVLTPSVSEDEGVAALLAEIGCDYVRIASVAMDTPQRMIVSHDRLGAAAAGHHLAELGHTRLAFISGPPTFRSSHERRAGFEEALNSHGLRLDPGYVREGAYTFESGIECAEALLALKPPPTAIFAGNDEMAAGVLQVALRSGLQSPRDISVVGFDDFQIASRLWPPLTTVRAPTRLTGMLAAQKLLGETTDGPPDAAETLPVLIVRQSSGPPGK
jgi:LacI family transcriptional regulator